MQPQGYKLQQLLQPYTHVESGHNEAMLFTLWLNPQIVLTSAMHYS